MANATARYIITADDQTKAAIDSVKRGFKSLESNVSATAHVMRLSLGILAGVQVKNLFRNILSATADAAGAQSGFAQALNETKEAARSLMAAKSGLPAATESLKELAGILKDPAVVSAADSITSTLIIGFTGAAKAIAQTIAGLKILTTGKGGDAAVDADSIVRKLEGQAQFFENDDSQTGRNKFRAIQNELRKARADYQQAIAGGDSTFLQADSGNGMAGLNAMMDAYEKHLAEQAAAETAAAEKRQANFDAYIRGIKIQIDYTDELDKAIAKTGETLNDVADKDMKAVADQIEQNMEDLDKSFKAAGAAADEMFRNIQDAMANFFFDPFKDGLKGMLRGFVDVLRRMVAEAAAADVIGAISGKGGGNLGSLFSGLKGLFGGFKAGGGPVAAGTSYVVGERGPELFTPGSSGMISPNGGGGVTVVINAPYSTKDSAQEFRAMVPVIIQQAAQLARVQVRDDMSRGIIR